MTQSERHKLIEKMSMQLFRAKQLRQGVVMSHQLVEQLVNDLRRLQRMEREREQNLANGIASASNSDPSSATQYQPRAAN